MKKLLRMLFVSVICFALVGCANVEDENGGQEINNTPPTQISDMVGTFNFNTDGGTFSLTINSDNTAYIRVDSMGDSDYEQNGNVTFDDNAIIFEHTHNIVDGEYIAVLEERMWNEFFDVIDRNTLQRQNDILIRQ
jgi:uncharacterized lipoprotein YehR (DUF1307 family)